MKRFPTELFFLLDHLEVTKRRFWNSCVQIIFMVGLYFQIPLFARKFTLLKYELFGRFWWKKNIFSTCKKFTKLEVGKKWEENVKSVDENWRVLDLMSVDNLTVQFNFRKWPILTKIYTFSQNFLVGSVWTLPCRSARYFLKKMNFE